MEKFTRSFSGAHVPQEDWDKVREEATGREWPEKMPIFLNHVGGTAIFWSPQESPRNVAAAFVDEILCTEHPEIRESDGPEKHMGPYQAALWKLEHEIGGDLFRILVPVLDEKPGEVRRVLREAFGQEGK